MHGIPQTPWLSAFGLSAKALLPASRRFFQPLRRPQAAAADEARPPGGRIQRRPSPVQGCRDGACGRKRKRKISIRCLIQNKTSGDNHMLA